MGGLVDYPSDDDDEDEEPALQNAPTPPNENDIPISPAKKQRISSSWMEMVVVVGWKVFFVVRFVAGIDIRRSPF